ncbi:MAG: glycosyltransferase [Methanobacterium sp. Maddingley MBC34]|nr:MAG: glycosyltransferase [Methanobacterium sp. Maddingley MBC34]
MIYIVSLQYSPIFKSHCYAMGNQLKKEGYEIKYLLSSQFQWMLQDEKAEEILFVGKSKDLTSILKDSINIYNLRTLKKLIEKDQPKSVYFHNIHPLFNYYIAKKIKSYGGRVIQHVHEPYVEDKGAYGLFQRIWLCVFEHVQEKLLKFSDLAVLSSDEAEILFNKRYSKFDGETIRVPLMYEDLGIDIENKIINRSYINFIGPPVSAKGPEKFMEIVDHASNEDMGFKFLIISRQNIEDKKKYNKYSNLEIFYQPTISDNKMGILMKNSIMTITPYKTARQSSVASMAYMYGVPVLASDIPGLNECVFHETTGYLVGLDKNADQWIKGIDYIKENFEFLSKNCRSYFVNTLSEKNWPKYFKEVFKGGS